MAVIQMFPEEFTELRQELAHPAHADVRLAFLEENTHTDMPSQLGVIAAALNVAVEGYYDQQSLQGLARVLTKRLVAKRQADAIWTVAQEGIIIPNNGGLLS